MDRYWVGGTANWDATAGTKWALTSGGAGGQAVPTSADDVFFDAASGAVTCTVSATVNSLSLNFTGFTGTFQMSNTVNVYGSCTLSAGMTFGTTGNNLQMLAETGSWTFTSAGKTVGPVRFGGTTGSPTFTLQDALVSSSAVTVAIGTFTTNNFNVTATQLSSSNSNTRAINLGSSTVTLSLANTSINFSTQTNLTFNAGTSSIVLTNNAAGFAIGSGVTFYNVSCTATAITTVAVQGANTFNNLSVTGRTTTGIANLSISADQTISGTLTLSAGTNATMRAFVRSDTIGTTRTLTCAAVAAPTDIDFRDITIAGAAAPVSGTRLGDCKGNSGITFGAGTTKYWNLAGGGNWATAPGWATSSGGTPAISNLPLAQDTALFEATGLNSGTTITISAAYNIGTIDMSARTSNTMTLAIGAQQPPIYGNWINGTGTTLTGTGTLTFAGRGSQTITSAGKTFQQQIIVDSLSGAVTLQDAITLARNAGGALTLTSGTFNANLYNVTLNGGVSTFVLSNSNVRTLAFGSGTWSLAGSGTAFNATVATNLTVTGTGTISLTSASAKTFAGGSIQTYPTLNQGGTGTLTVTGSNKFAGLTNTAIGRIQFTGGTTNEFTSFTINGVLGNLLQLGSTNTTQAILIKPTAWQMGLLSTDAGNNTGLNFLASDGTMNYLSVSYINGQVSTPSVTYAGNFFAFF